MRNLVILLVLSAATPALSQPFRDQIYAQDAARAADARAARDRDIALTNQLAVMQAAARTQQTLSDIAAARIAALAPNAPGAPPPNVDPSQLAEIPDAVLAASTARARAAADNRR